MKNRVMWYTDANEMKMINKNVSFVAVIDHANEWEEKTNDFDKAIEILRDLIESDGHHIYMGMGKWGFNCHYGHGHPRIMLKWCDTNTGKMQTKTVRVDGIDYQQLASYQTRYFAYLKGKYPNKTTLKIIREMD